MTLQRETSQVLTLANAVSAPVAGTAQYSTIQGRIQGHIFWTVQTSGTATAMTATIQFSLDGVHWANAAVGTLAAPNGTTAILAFTADTAQTAAVPYIRVNITAISGGNVTILAIGGDS